MKNTGTKCRRNPVQRMQMCKIWFKKKNNLHCI